jgi:hypothetical protein
MAALALVDPRALAAARLVKAVAAAYAHARANARYH